MKESDLVDPGKISFGDPRQGGTAIKAILHELHEVALLLVLDDWR